MTLFERHIELIERINNARTVEEHGFAELYLAGFRNALRIMRVNQLIDCDMYYISRGIDRPMCCGVFLDWKPEGEEK